MDEQDLRALRFGRRMEWGLIALVWFVIAGAIGGAAYFGGRFWAAGVTAAIASAWGWLHWRERG